MAVLVVSGSGCNAGKTAVGCALIRFLPEFCWTAVKTTSHSYFSGKAIWEETNASSTKDTGRYLASGAQHAFLVEDAGTPQSVESSLASIRTRVCSRQGLLLESNRIPLDLLIKERERGMSLAILSGIPANWKSSLLNRADFADALVLTGGFCCDQLPSPLRRKRVFQLMPGKWSSPELLSFVRRHLLR